MLYVAGARGSQEFELLTAPELIPLRRSAHDAPFLFVRLAQLFHFVLDEEHPGEWKVKTDGYVYTVTDDPHMATELISWHWHPKSRQDTHLHLGRGRGGLGDVVAKAHVPTGRIAFEEVVLFLIEDMGVEPARQDWEDVIADSLRRFRKYRRW